MSSYTADLLTDTGTSCMLETVHTMLPAKCCRSAKCSDDVSEMELHFH